jgi:Na+-transporting NADH:ubiquinone oxidoreductase subunit C
MNKDSPAGALLVVLGTALVCSILVSATVVKLRPIQQMNQLVDRSRNIVKLSGLVDAGQPLTDEDILKAVSQLDQRVVNLKSGQFESTFANGEFDSRIHANNPEFIEQIPSEFDIAGLTQHTRYEQVYLVWQDGALSRVIFPIKGQGMWSTLYGYIALDDDLSTIGAISFYEQAETAGLGDQITNPAWQALWQGKRLYDRQGNVQFRIAHGTSDSVYEIDGLSGATVTGDAVTRMINFWFGPTGYGPVLSMLQDSPIQPGQGNDE